MSKPLKNFTVLYGIDLDLLKGNTEVDIKKQYFDAFFLALIPFIYNVALALLTTVLICPIKSFAFRSLALGRVLCLLFPVW